MFKNYFVTAWRNMSRNKIYAAINILGFAIGISCCLIILLWVKDELSWDGFHQKKKQLSQVWENEKRDNGVSSQKNLPFPLAEELEKTIPEISHVAMIDDEGITHLLAYRDKKIRQKGNYVTPHFLEMFSYPLTQGSVTQALADQNSIVLTESVARALFNEEDPMNKIIRVDNFFDLKVSGVLKDLPANSTLQFSCLIPMKQWVSTVDWVRQSSDNWGASFLDIFTELNAGAREELVNQKIKDIIRKHNPVSRAELFLHPMNKWHLYSEFKDGKNTGGQIEYVRMFIIIAAFVLLIACINFMNLSTASSERRAKEVGIRKAIGSRRKELVYQFIGESMLMTVIAFVLAMGITSLILPVFNEIVQRKLSIDFSNPYYWITGLVFILFTGMLAGSYPAFYLSSFDPVRVLKGAIQVGKTAVIPRKVLVTLQFAFSILLIIGTIVVYLQLQYVKKRPLGYKQGNLIMLVPNEELSKNFPIIKTKLLSSGPIEAVSKSSSPITDVYAYMGGVEWPGKRADQRVFLATIATGYDYTKTIGTSIKTGRDFSEKFATDSAGMLLNEAAVKMMGLKSALGTIIKWNHKDYHIIGVTENILMTSPYQPVDPAITVYDAAWANVVLIRLKANADIKTSLAVIQSVYRKYCTAYPFEFHFADEEFAKKFLSEELVGKLANIFASLAIFISCLGLFGLVAFAAEQRKKEIGIRKTLGASVSHVVGLLSKDFLRLIVIAFIIASPIALYAMHHWLEGYAYRIAISWWIFGLSGLIVLLIAFITVSIQAIKAAIANPVKSLRNE